MLNGNIIDLETFLNSRNAKTFKIFASTFDHNVNMNANQQLFKAVCLGGLRRLEGVEFVQVDPTCDMQKLVIILQKSNISRYVQGPLAPLQDEQIELIQKHMNPFKSFSCAVLNDA